jgi:3-methylcrotonyl-CoA carboxylase alpha subunit
MRVRFGDRDVSIRVIAREPALRIAIDDIEYMVQANAAEAARFEIVLDGRVHEGWQYAEGDEIYLHLDGWNYRVQLPRAEGGGAAASAKDEVHAEMPGVLIGVHCEAGQSVGVGDKLVTIESMKLQLTLVSPRDGVVAKVHLPVESVFDRGALLVSLQPAEANKKESK